MNHLDEGTIHAWLDGGGALDATQSREIEAHVAGCAACSAAVAEARGLIAGASRILGALDDVPAGVIPGGAPAAPMTGSRDGVTPIASRRVAPRRWRVTRWASGIAAVLVAAIVLSTSSKVDRSQELAQTRQAARVDSAAIGTPRVAADEADTATGSAEEHRLAASKAVSEGPRVAAPTAGSALGRGVVAPSAGTSAPERRMAAPPENAPERREAVPLAPPAVTPAPARDAEMTAERVRGAVVTRTAVANQAKMEAAAVGVQQDTARMRTSVQRDTTRLRTTSDARLESVVVTGLGVARDSVAERFIGCYRIDAGRGVAGGVATGAAAGAGQRRVAGRAAAPSSAAAPQMSDFSARGLPPVVRLDTAETERGYMVRAARDSTIGSWRVVGDSVLIDFGPRGSVTLSARQRIECP